jgi:TolA-binding protein
MEIARTAPILLSLLLSGCFSFVTKEEGQKMQDQIADLTRRLSRMEETTNKELARLVADAQRLTTVLADSAQKAEKLQADLMQTKGQTEDIQKTLAQQELLQKNFLDYRAQLDVRLEQIERRLPKPPPPIPETPEALFAEAQRLFAARQWADARRMYEAFVSRYPTDKNAPQAQLHIGESFFNEGKYKNAIGAFTKVLDNYAKSDEAEAAMYKNGLGFYAIKRCQSALIYFKELLRRYPRTSYKSDANDQIKEISRQLRSPSACEPEEPGK